MKKLVRIFGAVYFSFAFMLLFGANAKAYIDPSVMTYVIQAVAGVAVSYTHLTLPTICSE